MSAAPAWMSYPVALESEASQVLSLKERVSTVLSLGNCSEILPFVFEWQPCAWHHNYCLPEADHDSTAWS